MTEIAYRSTHPRALDAWAEFMTARAAFREWASALTSAVVNDPRRQLYVRGYTVLGIARTPNESVPAGWRPTADETAIVPNRRSNAGKAAQDDLNRHSIPNPRSYLERRAGMSSGLFAADSRWLEPGVGLFEDGAAVYVTWSREPDWATWAAQPPPADVWEQVPLSRYYAAREAWAAARESAGAA